MKINSGIRQTSSHTGFILLTTMVTMSVLALLVITLRAAVFLSLKMSHQAVKKHDSFYQLESAAFQLNMKHLNKTCVSKESDPNHVIKQILSKTDCTFIFNHKQYVYLISDAGQFPCLPIIDHQVTYNSHHWLLSMRDVLERKDVLQLRIATPELGTPCNEPVVRQIKAGLVSWRYLSFPASKSYIK